MIKIIFLLQKKMKIDELMNKIKEARPNLSVSSLKSYKSVLSSLYSRMNPRTDFDGEFFVKKSEDVLKFLSDMEPSKRKTILSSLVVACSALDKDCSSANKYREQMYNDADKTRAQIRNQQKSSKQEQSWLSWEKIVEFFEDMRKSTMPLWSKARLTSEEFNRLQDLVILSVYVLIPPRRLLDYVNFKIRNADRETDNYIDKQKTLVFNTYKTAKHYGEQRVEMPNALKTIISKWMKVQLQSDYLIMDTDQKPMSQSKLTTRLNKIFSPTGKRISVNILRHSYLTQQYKDIPALTKIVKNSEDMGHSIEQALEYVKR